MLKPEEELTTTFLIYICTLQYVVLNTSSPRWLVSFFALIRVMYHTSFWFVIAGVVYSDAALPHSLLAHVAIVYVSFNVLLYGGIYSMNAITDMTEDRAHPTKRLRPLPSGDVSLPMAYAFMLSAWAGGFGVAYYVFGMRMVYVYACFWAVNVFYSFYARHVPLLDTLCNGATYGLRVHLGCVIRGGTSQWSHVLAGVLVGVVMAASRRLLEKRSINWTNRAVSGWIRAQWWLMMSALLALFVHWLWLAPRWLSSRLLCVAMWFAIAMIQQQRAVFVVLTYVVMLAQMWWSSVGGGDGDDGDGREPYRAESLVVLLGLGVATFIIARGGNDSVLKRVIEKTFL